MIDLIPKQHLLYDYNFTQSAYNFEVSKYCMKFYM